MLVRIHCDKFADFIENKTIEFKSGLNVVLGQNDKANSIGKSTLLMMIDFCFGGSKYASKDSDVIQNIGHHAVDFTFRFDGVEYNFSRDTDMPNNCWECDSEFNREEKNKSLDYLKSFLKTHYLPKDVSFSFRDVVSRFMRINGKNNYNVLKPLKNGGHDEKDSKGISVLEELYGIDEAVINAKRELEQTKQDIVAYRTAKKGQYIYVSFSSEKECAEKKAKLEELRAEIERIKSLFSSETEEEPKEFSDKALEIKSELDYKIRKRGSLKAKLSKLSSRVGDLFMTEDDISSIKRLFPEAKIKTLMEIKNFQKDLKTNVNEEIENQQNEINREIQELNEAIGNLKMSLRELNVEPKAPRAVLEDCISKEREAGSLSKQIEYFEKEAFLKQTRKDQERFLDNLEMDRLAKMVSDLNERFSEINKRLYVSERMAPTLSISDSSKYEFRTPNDSGTGTMFKSLLVFDIGILEITSLPVLIHDSLLFSDIWHEPLSKIISEYKKQTKQVFIAFDGQKHFDDETKKAIQEKSVIYLGTKEHSLFGRSWALVNED